MGRTEQEIEKAKAPPRGSPLDDAVNRPQRRGSRRQGLERAEQTPPTIGLWQGVWVGSTDKDGMQSRI